MSFADILRETVEAVDGAVAAVLMGSDGIAVDQHVRPGSDCDVEAVAVEFSRVMEEIKKASGILGFGKVQEIVIGSDGTSLVIRPVNADYHITLVLSGGANAAKARYLLKKAAKRTGKEL